MYKSIIRTIAFLAILTFSASAYAQSVEVSGTVTDEAGPLIGATVIVKGSTTNAVVTDIDGKYAIKVNAGETLVYSYIGYNDEERTVTANAVIDVMMSADVAMLEQVVVLGYGAQTKKKDLSASVGVVTNTEQLAQRPVTSTQSMLQGQIPGVNITNDGGDPTSSPNIVIRGQGSQNGDNVLWVVDGVPGAPINSMNDIESIVVLKDAASAAIYGAISGAGGVVLVTTKKGKEGVNVIYDGLVGVRRASKMIQSLDAEQEREMYRQAYENSGKLDEFLSIDGWNPEKNPYIATTRTDWMDEVFRTALYHRHNVVVNAGTEKFKNRLGFSYTSDDGILVGTYKKELGINYVGDIQIVKWVKLTENFRWGQVDQNSVSTTGTQSGGILSAMQFPRSAEVHQWDGTGYGGVTTEDPAYIAKYGVYNVHGDLNNPLRELTANNKTDKSNQVYTSTALEVGNFDNFKGFKFISRFTYQLGSSFYKNFTPKPTEIGNKDGKNSLNYQTYRSETWRTENTITYDRTFGKHTVGALLSTTADHYTKNWFSVTGEGFKDEAEALQYLTYASVINATDKLDDRGPDANQAIIARLSYSYDDRYFVTASWRRDYAARLPKNNNYGDFPAATAAWKISSEKFFPKTNAVTLLKLRASWGRIGNLGSVGYNYKSNTLSTEYSSDLAQYGILSNTTYGSMVINNKVVNNNLTWETSEQTDIGLDVNFLKDRLTFSADFYDKRTYNLIQNQSTGWTSSIGYDPLKINLGEIKNRGVELALGWNDRVGNWSYYVNANAAYNKNWVSDIGIKNSDGTTGAWTGESKPRDITFSYRTEQGGELNQYYLIRSLGIFQTQEEIDNYTVNGKKIQPDAQPGDLKFEDYNGDGVIDSGDRQLMGNSTPDWTFALNAGFTWKNLSVSMMFQGVEGAQALNFSKMASLSASSKSHNRSTEILNAWSETNRGSNIPRLARKDANGNFTTASSWYLENTSYIRLKNLTISYDITNAIRKAKFFNDRNSALSVYISGENLFTITKYSGLDPECGGEDMFKYPVSRVLSFGLKLTL